MYIYAGNSLSGALTLSGVVLNGDSTSNIYNILPTTKNEYCGIFNGNSDSALWYPDSTALSLAGYPFTIECWVNPSGDYSTERRIFAKTNDSGTFSYTGYLASSNGYISFQSDAVYNSTTKLSSNVWSHCAWVYDGSKINIYVNGVSVYNSTVSITDVSSSKLRVGGGYDDSQNLFSGKIYNLRIIKGLALYTSNFLPPKSPLTNYTVTNSFSTVFLGLDSNSVADRSVYNATPTVITGTQPIPTLGFTYNILNNVSVYSSIFNNKSFEINKIYPHPYLYLNNVNFTNNYILSTTNVGLNISNTIGTVSMTNNTTVGSLSYGTYLFNNTLTGSYGSYNYNSLLQGMMVSSNNTGIINGGGLNSAKEGIYFDSSSSNLTDVSFQDIFVSNNSSAGFKVSGNSSNYQSPISVNIKGLTALNNNTYGIEAYNIFGILSSITLTNNLSGNMRTSIGNGITIFDGLTSVLSGECLSILSGYNYNPFIIRNSFLSSTKTVSGVGINLDSTRFSQFVLENSILSSSIPLQLNTTRNLIEGSYLINNSYLGSTPLGTGITNKYQQNAYKSTGFAFTDLNNVQGYNTTYLVGGTKSLDYVTPSISDNDVPSELLLPNSITAKLRSGSKFVAVDKYDTTTVSVYVRKSVSSDGTAYNGNDPRLILARNPAAGIYSDTVIDILTTSKDVSGGFVELTGNTDVATENGVFEFYVDCDGTAGWINIDNWTAV